jgi:S-adenosylmethionine:diacylglycerol 3-amino-3-carboxypropyl transferase
VSLEESVRAVVREELKRVLREELRSAIEQLRAAPNRETEFLSVKEAAELTRVSEATVRDWMTRGTDRGTWYASAGPSCCFSFPQAPIVRAKRLTSRSTP